MLKVIFAIIIGYLLVKSFRFFKSIFNVVNAKKNEEKVYGSSEGKSKIDKKDVIDAQFEEIDETKNTNSKK